MTRELLILSVLLASVLTIGCSDFAGNSSTPPDVVDIESDAPDMLAAIKTAQKTMSFFEQNWRTMDNDGASLKFALPTPDGGREHIWFMPTKILSDKITGKCSNVPVGIPGLNIGDVRTVSRDDISDWMIVVGDKCYGGYTIRVMAEREPDVCLLYTSPSPRD